MSFCPNCGTKAADGELFCTACGTSISPSTEQSDFFFDDAPKKKGHKGLIITLSSIAAVLLTTAVVGLCTNWFGLVSPIHKLVVATKNTIKADSITLDIKAEEDGEDVTANVRFAMDPKEKELTALIVEERDDYKSETLIYKGEEYYKTYYEENGKTYANEHELDTDEFFDEYNDIVDEEKKIDWDEVVEKTDSDDYLNADEIEPFLNEFYKEYLCSKKWLKENTGFEKKGNTYTFRPDVEKLCDEMREICSDSDALSSDGKKEVREALKEMEENADDLELEISFTVKGKYLSAIHIKFDNDGYDGEITINISNVNSTKFNETEIKEFKNEVSDIIDDNTCSYCDEVITSYWSEEYHKNCTNCGAHGYVYENGKCYSCEYNYGYCERCGDYKRRYTSYYGYKLCYYCYDYNYYYYR